MKRSEAGGAGVGSVRGRGIKVELLKPFEEKNKVRALLFLEGDQACTPPQPAVAPLSPVVVPRFFVGPQDFERDRLCMLRWPFVTMSH
jgi:hypothetical protein